MTAMSGWINPRGHVADTGAGEAYLAQLDRITLETADVAARLDALREALRVLDARNNADTAVDDDRYDVVPHARVDSDTMAPADVA